jgi:hypothetical protein
VLLTALSLVVDDGISSSLFAVLTALDFLAIEGAFLLVV